jgi:hypothetical protein
MTETLGRLTPTDFEHVERYPFSAVEPTAVTKVEETLDLPRWHWTHDQGREGSCVGHACAMERAITNAMQARKARRKPYARRYDPLHIWNEAKKIDEWPNTNPGDTRGTSVRAAYDILRDLGPCRVRSVRTGAGGVPEVIGGKPADVAEGVDTNRWATTVDEIRTAIADGLPVVFGIDWYRSFDSPTKKGNEQWIGEGSFGVRRGGHAVCIYGASDRRQAFRVKNSWDRRYPLVWLTYAAADRLLQADGEAALVTDR